MDFDDRCTILRGRIMKEYLLATLLFFIFPLPIWGQTPTLVPQESISLVFSSTVQGEVEPCG